MKKYLVLLTFAACSLASCGGDDLADCTASSFNDEVNAAIDDLNNAVTAYNSDPSTSNCDAVKDAANGYLDTVEDLDGCAGISDTDYQSALSQARDAVNSLAC